MVWGPALRPAAVSSVRRFTINATTSAGVRVGELFGRRDRASKAASPSVR